MKYYSREITERKAVNRFGRLGYVQVAEYVKTNSIDAFNKGKRIKFVESADARKYLLHKNADQVYKEDLKVLSKTW